MLEDRQDDQVAVLASGDALVYGVGSWLIKLIGNENLIFRPNVSSVQYCFHALRLPWQQAEMVSLHGRPLYSLRRHIRSNHLIAVFTDQKSNPRIIADELVEQGFGESEIWVCQAMAQNGQNISEFTALELSNHEGKFDPLNICIIRFSRPAANEHKALPAFPGIADEQFVIGSAPGYGMISKREIRLSILSMMSPEIGEIAWDIGAGCGSVSVEWARWNNQGQIYAVEKSEQRIDNLIANSEKFGTTLNLTPVQGAAPEACDSLPDPDSILSAAAAGSGRFSILPGIALNRAASWWQARLPMKVGKPWKNLWKTSLGDSGSTLEIEKNLPEKTQNRKLKPVTVAACIKA